MRVLGIDYGGKRIGLAISGEDQDAMALPLCTLENQPQSVVDQILEIVTQNKVGRIIVGLPLQMQGKEGLASFRVKKFVNQLLEKIDVPIDLWDERMTTAEAQKKLRSLNVGSRKQKKIIDEAAAQIILQSYLDAQGEPS